MSKTSTLIPVEEYLHTSYHPDREYVDGDIQERNLGEKDHSKIQKLLTAFFLPLEETTELRVWPEQRVQVKAARFRVPDICVTLGEPNEQIFTDPPFIVIEILSPEDTLARLLEKVQDYLEFGVRHIWVIDPGRSRGYVVSPQGGLEPTQVLRTQTKPHITLDLEKLFA